jgi:hypothetical protein
VVLGGPKESSWRRQARAQTPTHRQYVGRPGLQALESRQRRQNALAFIIVKAQDTRWLFHWRIQYGSDLEKELLVFVENLLLVQYLKIYAETIGFLAKHRGMGCPDQADHHEDELIVRKCD